MTYLAIIIVLTFLNGFFALSEAALVSARKTRLQELQKSGRAGATTALKLSENPERVFSTVQLGITLIGVISGAFGAAPIAEALAPWLQTWPLIAPFAGTVSLLVVVVGITVLSIVVGELIPKRIAVTYPARISVAVAPVMDLLARILHPAVWALNFASTTVLKAAGFRERRHNPMSEEEIHIILAEGAEAGVLSPGEQTIATRALQLEDRRVDSIMTPRRDVVWLEWQQDIRSLLSTVVETQHSYYPVGAGGIETLKGIISSRSLWALSHAPDGGSWRQEITPPLCVPGSTNIVRLLELFRKKRTRIAVVVDEYGGVDGLVSLSDILAVLIGEIPDEDDAFEETAIVLREDGSFLVSGSTPIHDLEERLQRTLRPSDAPHEYQTVAGFAFSALGHVPTVGEKFTFDGMQFEIMDMDGARIDKILVSVPKPLPENQHRSVEDE